MKTIFQLLILILLTNACTQKSEVNIVNLKIEYKVNPLGVDIVQPRFSWNLESEQRGISQSAYQLLVASSLENLNDNWGDIWDSKRIDSGESIQIYYNGDQLDSDQKYFWKVKVWDQDGKEHTSESVFWMPVRLSSTTVR